MEFAHIREVELLVKTKAYFGAPDTLEASFQLPLPFAVVEVFGNLAKEHAAIWDKKCILNNDT